MATKSTILIVDDDQDILVAAKLLLKRHFDQVIICDNPEKIVQHMHTYQFDAILLDMNFGPGESSGAQGLICLERILALDANAVVVMITAHGDIHIAVEAMKKGATDFITKPWQNEKIVATLSAVVKLRKSRKDVEKLKRTNQLLRQVNNQTTTSQLIIGKSRKMQELMRLIRLTAPTDANILILGENGTGKEVIANTLHALSKRSEQSFMSIDIGAVSESVLESELFGHKKGAFTGAETDRIGRFEAAHNGTLFLDEITNLALHKQTKLLTVLEQRQVVPVGSNNPVPIDVRVITATNATYETLNNEQHFRQDLLFRLNTIELVLPPLRERAEDIEEIARYYASMYSKKYNKPDKDFSTQTIKTISSYDWPGNVRALRHAVERAVILCQSNKYEPVDFPCPETNTIAAVSEKETLETPVVNDKNFHLNSMEYKLIKQCLNKHKNNISQAAKELGITRTALYRRIEKHGI